jgi:hypothetical protein
MTWKQAFWKLFHYFKDWLTTMEAREEVQGRRKYDGAYAGLREDIDRLVNELPKE